MKRLILFILITVLGTAPALYSQTVRHDQKDMSWGIKGGLNVAWMSDFSGGYVKLGATVGLLGMIKINNVFGISSEMLYSKQGECDRTNDNSSGDNLHYINVPILANLYIPGLDGLSIKAGIQYGLLLSGSNDYWDRYRYGYASNSQFDYNYNTTDWSIPFGVSYEWGNGFFVDMRCNVGITLTTEDKSMDIGGYGEEDYLYNNGEYREENRVLQLTVGYRF